MRYPKSLSILLVFALFAIPVHGQSVTVSPALGITSSSSHIGALGTGFLDAPIVAGAYYNRHKQSAYVGPTVRIFQHDQADLHFLLGVGATSSNEQLAPNIERRARQATTASFLSGFEARYDGRSIIIGVQYDSPLDYNREITQWPTGWRFMVGFGPRF